MPSIFAEPEAPVTCRWSDVLAGDVLTEHAVTEETLHGAADVLFVWLSPETAEQVTATQWSLVGVNELQSWFSLVSELNPTAANVVAAQLPGTQAFTTALAAWPRAWPNRLAYSAVGTPRLLRLELHPEALWVVLRGSEVVVRDSSGTVLELTSPAVTAERIAGFFVASVEAGEEETCEVDQRRLVLTNPNLVERWSVGDVDVENAMKTEIGRLEKLLEVSRPCPPQQNAEAWVKQTACSNYAGEGDLFGSYERSLVQATEGYYPGTRQLVALIDTLRDDLRQWKQSPLVVVSNWSPPPSTDTSGDAGSKADGGATDAGTQDAAARDGGCCESASGDECCKATQDSGCCGTCCEQARGDGGFDAAVTADALGRAATGEDTGAAQ